MRTQRPLLGLLVFLVVVLTGGCGKSLRREQFGLADIETTNSQATTGMVRFEARPGSKLRIEGTSNLHDWQVESTLVGGYLEVGPGFPVESDQPIKPGGVDARAEVFIAVRTLRSIEKDGKPYSDKMDEVMYEKLKSLNDPKARIAFRLAELELKGVLSGKGGPFECEAKGDLAVAGVTNRISIPIQVFPLEPGRLKICGRASIKMTAFGIQPPSPSFPLLGALIKTGDQVNLIFEWVVASKKLTAPLSR